MEKYMKIIDDDRLSYAAKGLYFVIKYINNRKGITLMGGELDNKALDNNEQIFEYLSELLACGYANWVANHEKRSFELRVYEEPLIA